MTPKKITKTVRKAVEKEVAEEAPKKNICRKHLALVALVAVMGTTIAAPADWIKASLVKLQEAQTNLSANMFRQQALKYQRAMEKKEGSGFNKRHSSKRPSPHSTKYKDKEVEGHMHNTAYFDRRGSQIRNQRYSQRDTRDAYRRDDKITHAKPSRVVDQVYTRWRTSLTKGRVSLKRISDTRSVFQTYKNNEFSLQVPQYLEAEQGSANHKFESKKSDLKVFVKKVEEGCGEGALNTGCVANLSRDENSRLDIAYTTQLVRKSYNSDTVLHDRSTFKVYTESFVSHIYGKELYIARAYVEDLTSGGIYIIETHNGVNTTHKYLETIKKILDSFRLY